MAIFLQLPPIVSPCGLDLLLSLDFNLPWYWFRSPWLLLPLPSIFKVAPEDSPGFLLRLSSLRIKSRIAWNFNFFLWDELVIAIIVALQLPGRKDNKIKAFTSSSNLISTELNWVMITLNSLMWFVTEAPSSIFRLKRWRIKYYIWCRRLLINVG